jgi:quinol-cytochrome oxidoreductase complex cytochrome b subunit
MPASWPLLALCASILIFGFVVDGRWGAARLPRLRRFAWILQIGALVGAYFVLRPGRAPGDPKDAIEAARVAQAPIFVDFYSNS